MIPESAWRCNTISTGLGAGCKCVLLALWDHAHGWRQGDDEWFVYPSIDTLISKLGIARSTVYRALGELRRAGWIREALQDGRTGWWLSAMPGVAAAAPDLETEAQADAAQLGFVWDNSTCEAANEPVDAPVDNPVLPTSAPARVRPASWTDRSSNRDAPPSMEQKSNSTPHDDASRIWSAYEAARVRMLGGRPRTGPAPTTIRSLWRELGGNADAWAKVERYGQRALELALAAKTAGRDAWPRLVECRSDGREWSRARYDAVMAWQGSAFEHKPSTPPPPPPVVDGIEVDRFEREDYEAGGEDAVRLRRAMMLTFDAIGSRAEMFLEKLRGVG